MSEVRTTINRDRPNGVCYRIAHCNGKLNALTHTDTQTHTHTHTHIHIHTDTHTHTHIHTQTHIHTHRHTQTHTHTHILFDSWKVAVRHIGCDVEDKW